MHAASLTLDPDRPLSAGTLSDAAKRTKIPLPDPFHAVAADAALAAYLRAMADGIASAIGGAS